MNPTLPSPLPPASTIQPISEQGSWKFLVNGMIFLFHIIKSRTLSFEFYKKTGVSISFKRFQNGLVWMSKPFSTYQEFNHDKERIYLLLSPWASIPRWHTGTSNSRKVIFQFHWDRISKRKDGDFKLLIAALGWLERERITNNRSVGPQRRLAVSPGGKSSQKAFWIKISKG